MNWLELAASNLHVYEFREFTNIKPLNIGIVNCSLYDTLKGIKSTTLGVVGHAVVTSKSIVLLVRHILMLKL